MSHTLPLAHDSLDLSVWLHETLLDSTGTPGMDVSTWLRDLGLEDYVQAFQAHHIDAEVLPRLTADDLIALGITSIGHRRKLLDAIAALDQGRAATAAAPIGVVERPVEAERRQLTVLFCDLVGSTEFAARLDPEDLREVMRAYQATCADVVRRFEGHVARLLGDGVLAYFGWPQAHEDDAERAVRAGLQLVEDVARLELGAEVRLQARVGVATGHVVVGDLISERISDKDAVSGDTPNLAARLQAIAAPASVVISQSTRRLVGGLFELIDLGPQRLKGFAEPLSAWQVEGQGRAEGRFEARHSAGLTPLVGREEEIALLLRRWHQAQGGEGQVVLLSGEPGIGKSRLVRELRERIVAEPHLRLTHQCSPYHQTSPLHPLIQHLERAARFERDDPPAAKLDKLEALLAAGPDKLDQAVPLIAALLGLPTNNRYKPLNLTPQRQKQRTLAVLVDQLEGLAAVQPVLVTYEDVHWIDPTTQELLGLAIERIQRLPVLLLITMRPEFTPPWGSQPHVSALALTRLGRRESAGIVDRLVGAKALPDEVAAQIVAKTDGVPLFIEELTKAVLESNVLQETDDSYVLAGPLRSLAIPNTLHDSLMARLDRLAPTKETAQVAAVIGREFSYELLRAVSRLGEDELDRALASLVESELVMRHGTSPDATFVFKHALVQEAAYGSLLRDRRRHLHGRIATVLEARSPETVEQQPELIAHHFDQAGFFEEAATYWLQAGQRAAQRSANMEAIAHLTRCVEALRRLPDTPQHARRELRCQLALGPALLATRGWNALEAATAYRRARALCERLGEDRERFNALWGLWLFHTTRGEIEVAYGLITELFQIAQRLDDPALRLQAHHAAWADTTWLGDPLAAHEHVRQGLAIYDPGKHRDHALLYGGHDPGVCGRGQGALSLWLLGYPDQAKDSARAAVDLAVDLGHAPSLAHALFWSALCDQFRREGAPALACSQRLIALAGEQGLRLYAAAGMILRGWALAAEGKARQGLAELRRGLEAYTAIEIKLLSSFFKAALAETLHRAGKAEAALLAVDDALSLADQTAEHFWQAAMLHLKGELFLAADPPDHAQAEASLRAAIDVARQQQARSLELRAATSLARTWAERGRRAEACDLLAPIYGWFTEGFDSADLKDAKALLDELA